MGTIINGAWQPLEHIDKEVTEVEHHLHNRERWIGEHGARNLEVDCGATGTMAVFQSTAGDDAWSATPLCLIGTGDGPFITGMTKYDAHYIIITDVAVAADVKRHYCRLVYGTGTVGDAITAGQFTEFRFTPERGKAHTPIPIICPRITYGTEKLWITHWVDGVTNPTMDFTIGVHEYEV